MNLTRLLAKGVVAIIFLLLVSFFNQTAFGEVGVTGDTIKIGATGGLTGPLAFICGGSLMGAKAYYDMVNDNGGIHGRKIKFIIEDDGYQPNRTVAAAMKLITRDQIFAFSTTQGSATTLALRNIITENKIPLVAPHLPALPFFDRYIFFLPMNFYSDQPGILLKYVIGKYKLKEPTLGVIYQNDVYGEMILKGIDEALKVLDIKLVAKEPFERGGTVGFASQVFKLRKANPDIVFVGAVTDGSSGILTEIKKIGWSPIRLGSAASGDDKVVELAGDAANNFYVAGGFEPPHSKTPGVLQMLKVLTKYAPDQKPGAYFTSGYISAMIMCEGLKRAGRELTREKLVEALETLNNYDTGLSPPVTYGKNNRVAARLAAIFVANVKEKRFDKITDWLPPISK